MTNSILSKINDLPIFSKETFRSLHIGSEGLINYDITRFIKSGYLVLLKSGLYTSKEYLIRNNINNDYLFFIANSLRQPSYVSLETILLKYNVLTDVTYNVWSITTKVPRKYKNKLGYFLYKQIKPGLFTGYVVKKAENGNILFEATKSKALFDYIYYKADSIKINTGNLVEDLRLNLDEFKSSDWKEIKEYCKLANIKKINLIFENIKSNASN